MKRILFLLVYTSGKIGKRMFFVERELSLDRNRGQAVENLKPRLNPFSEQSIR